MPDQQMILTISSKKRLEEELKRLRYIERPHITEDIKKAREYGDLSENFEYQAARRAQGILNGRIAEIEAILQRSKVIEDGLSSDVVQIGATVVLRDTQVGDDELEEYMIVDETSANPDINHISYTSPIGKALMQRKKGDEVEVKLPNNATIVFQITDLRYS